MWFNVFGWRAVRDHLCFDIVGAIWTLLADLAWRPGGGSSVGDSLWLAFRLINQWTSKETERDAAVSMIKHTSFFTCLFSPVLFVTFYQTYSQLEAVILAGVVSTKYRFIILTWDDETPCPAAPYNMYDGCKKKSVNIDTKSKTLCTFLGCIWFAKQMGFQFASQMWSYWCWSNNIWSLHREGKMLPQCLKAALLQADPAR